MTETARTFLMYAGKAQEALTLYQTAFPTAKTGKVEHYGAENEAMQGQIKWAEFAIGGHVLVLNDTPPVHDFSFTPSISIFVECGSLPDFEEKFAMLSEDGKILMPPDNYGFSSRFAWAADRFGVSWQLSVA